jgi:segregation and condensation protein A
VRRVMQRAGRPAGSDLRFSRWRPGAGSFGGVTLPPGFELDLDVFSGPFDLFVTLVLREEIDLLEVPIAEVIDSYLHDRELDVDAASEFIALMAALLELKSRRMLAEDDVDELPSVDPEEAFDELLGRMVDAHRFRGAARFLGRLLAAQPAVRYREVPLPPHLRRSQASVPPGSWPPGALGRVVGRLLAMPPALDLKHIAAPRVAVGERIAHVRGLLEGPSGEVGFDQAVQGADRMTVAVTLFALLELHKEGQASWTQQEPFGEISIRAVPPTVADAPCTATGSRCDPCGPR